MSRFRYVLPVRLSGYQSFHASSACDGMFPWHPILLLHTFAASTVSRKAMRFEVTRHDSPLAFPAGLGRRIRVHCRICRHVSGNLLLLSIIPGIRNMLPSIVAMPSPRSLHRRRVKSSSIGSGVLFICTSVRSMPGWRAQGNRHQALATSRIMLAHCDHRMGMNWDDPQQVRERHIGV